MTFKEKLYTMLGDIWLSGRSVALWPWPAIAVEWPRATLNWDHYRAVTSLIQPGDMLLTREDAFIMSNMAIPGKHKHLAVYTGTVSGIRSKTGRIVPMPSMPGLQHTFDRTITHATSDGVICQDLGEFFFDCDCITVVRPWKTADQQKKIVDSVIAQIGKGYDFGFDKDHDGRFYCTELGAYGIRQADIMPPPLAQVRGHPFAFLWERKTWMKAAYIADKFVEAYPVVVSVGR